jgi:ribosome-binding factor A
MSSRRIAKVAEALRETISTTVLFGLKDPRLKNVTVLGTDVSPDLKSARVRVSVMGDEKAQSLAMHGLRSARGYIQSQIAEKLELRYTPILQFVLDPGIKMSIETSSIIRQALASSNAGASGAVSDAGEDEEGESHVAHDALEDGPGEDGPGEDGQGEDGQVEDGELEGESDHGTGAGPSGPAESGTPASETIDISE